MKLKKIILLIVVFFEIAPIFAQDALFDSATASDVSTETRFRSLSDPAIPTTARLVSSNVDSAATKKYVLTRLETIYEGTIRDRGDSILVELENGGSISVSKIDVLFVADSRTEIFEFKKSRTRLDDANDALQLADWANRRQFGLEGIALLETFLAASNDPDERRVFERKLAELRETEKIRAEIARTIAVRDAKKLAENNDEPSAASANVDELKNAELEDWAKQIPFAALERFSRKAQPVLQKRCAATECHNGSNPDATGYVLQPKALGAEARLALLRNLRETFDFVDFENPKQSPILNHPIVVDATGARVYPFGDDRASSKDCASFVDWISTLNDGKLGRYVHSPSRNRSVESLASRPGAVSRYDVVDAPQSADARPSQQADASTSEPLFDSAVANVPSARPTERVAQNDGVIRLGLTDAARTRRSELDDPNSAETRLKRVGAIPERTYRDEYDPAIFNARYQTGDATRRY